MDTNELIAANAPLPNEQLVMRQIGMLMDRASSITEAQIRLAMATLLLKLGERSIVITPEDVARAEQRVISVEGDKDGMLLKIL